ncbi:hypothetical protein QYQ98_03875 [Corynebacterium sp. P3-F1]|uniref:hypothetical protein n=1 Tax=Corynebacterium sp. P3-F1 TaxID=3059080 RepID=UPI00265CEBA7|nr:hypothetical protein [Corynebacterium sp. P3-F1]WKK62029.1 hypothetical protein QYQ98_03875 [Corynebacterium sp. P3-F1]
MATESLRIDAGAAGLKALVERALALDSTGSARFSTFDANPDTPAVDVFVTTPFNCVASRRVAGQASRDGAVVSLQDLRDALAAGDANAEIARPLEIGPARDANWLGALSPKTGFTERDIVPVNVVRDLADQGRRLARQFSGPMGPPRSLLEQIVLTADAEETSGPAVNVPMRMIFTCTSLGLIPGPGAPVEIPRHLRVSTAGRWIRLDAPFGSVYYTSGGINLFG